MDVARHAGSDSRPSVAETTVAQLLEPSIAPGALGALSIRQFCHAYGVNVSTFYRWQDNGLAPDVLEVGGRRFITYAAVREWERKAQRAA